MNRDHLMGYAPLARITTEPERIGGYEILHLLSEYPLGYPKRITD